MSDITIKIGVSACLLGRKVRFDGGHKRSRFIADALADHFEFVAFCPEVEIGMGTPRQPIRLVGDDQNPQAVGVKTPELNVSQPLLGYLKRDLDSAHRTDLNETIEAYRRGEFPLVVPIRMLQHYFRVHPDPYIKQQVYLNPHPQALLLRNSL